MASSSTYRHPAPPRGGEQDQYIESQVQKTQVHVRIVELATVLSTLAAGILAFLHSVCTCRPLILPRG